MLFLGLVVYRSGEKQDLAFSWGSICLVLLHLMIPDRWTGYKTWSITFYDGFSALSTCLEHVRPCVLRDAGLGIFRRICCILLHLCVPDQWHGFWAWNWTSFDGFSALSTHLECVRLCRLQEDLSSNRGAGHGWCLWPMFGSGTIQPWHPRSTNQPIHTAKFIISTFPPMEFELHVQFLTAQHPQQLEQLCDDIF